MMEIGIREFMEFYHEGLYDTDNKTVTAKAQKYGVHPGMYEKNKRYRNAIIQWMDEIYKLVSGITNQTVLDGFYIKARCDEMFDRVNKQYRLLLIPYDTRLVEKCQIDIHIRVEDRNERKYWIISDKLAELQSEADLLAAVNGICPGSETVTYRARITFLGYPSIDVSDDTDDVLITVPGGVSMEEVTEAIRNQNAELARSNGYTVKSPEEILDAVCENRGWLWEEALPDIEMTVSA